MSDKNKNKNMNMNMNIKIPAHESIVIDGDVSVHCLACPRYDRGVDIGGGSEKCSGQAGPGLPQCDRSRQAKARQRHSGIDEYGDWTGGELAEDSPAIAGRMDRQNEKQSDVTGPPPGCTPSGPRGDRGSYASVPLADYYDSTYFGDTPNKRTGAGEAVPPAAEQALIRSEDGAVSPAASPRAINYAQTWRINEGEAVAEARSAAAAGLGITVAQYDDCCRHTATNCGRFVDDIILRSLQAES